MTLIREIFMEAWKVYNASAFYMLLGFFVAGLLYVFIKADKIGKYLGKGKVRPVLLSALFGIPLPLCSCGVIPAAAGLKRQGANNGATLSFLISTPETGVDSIPITYALMGPVMAVIRPLAAFVTAVAAGITENLLNGGTSNAPVQLQSCGCSGNGCADNSAKSGAGNDESTPWPQKLRTGLSYAFDDLIGDIAGYFTVGILIAGLIGALVPAHLIELSSKSSLLSMLIMLAAGIPMYVCATSSTPIAAALLLKGLSPGAALVFLLAGPATNAASLSMVSGLLGKRALTVYLGAIIACSLLLGILTDLLFSTMGLSVSATMGKAQEILPAGMAYGASALLALLIVRAFYKWYKNSVRTKPSARTTHSGQPAGSGDAS